jgi:hypothetical protein
LRLLVLVLATACSTINIKNYSTDCDADNACERIVVGDICACTCQLGAINIRDDSKYINDLEQIGACQNTCIDADGGEDAGYSCGIGIGAHCVSGTCATYMVPVDASSE